MAANEIKIEAKEKLIAMALKDIPIGTIVQDTEHYRSEQFIVDSFDEINAYLKPVTGKTEYEFSCEFEDLCPFQLNDTFYISKPQSK